MAYRGRVLLAVSVVAAIGAGIGWVKVSRRLDQSEARVAQLNAESGAARADAADAERNLEEAEKRLRRHAELRRYVRELKAQDERPADAACFEDYYGGREDVHGPLRGDVDGDAVPDRVYTVGLPLSKGRCDYRVVVDLGAGGLATASPRTARHATQVDDLRAALTPALLVELNETRGHEVVVVTSRGATGGGYQLFTMVDDRLEPMERPGKFGWSFGSSASAGGGTGWDCVGPATIVEGQYGYSVRSKDHSVERRFYRVEGATLVPTDVETYDLPYGSENRFPELGGGDGAPFPNCRDRIPSYRPPR